MDEDQAKQLNGYNKSGCCYKAAFKCCLFYFTALVILALIFTGANNEPKDATQTKWWWAFIGSLLLTGSLTATALAILIYTDYYKPYEDGAQPDPVLSRQRPSRRAPGYMASDMPEPPKNVPARSNSKNNAADAYLGTTIREEPAMDSNQLPVVQADAAPEASQTNFVNLTPDSAKSPVTVVDMTTARNNRPPRERSNRINATPATPATVATPASPAPNRIEQPSNLASVISNLPIQDDNKKKKKRLQKKK